MKAKGHLGHTGHTGPTIVPPPTGEVQAIMNGEITPADGRPKITMEEQMSDKQLDRLAGGVTVDTGSAESMAPTEKPEKPSMRELRTDVIRIIPVENDGEPLSRILLVNLKCLFQKQLPVMPREYIARLVFDHTSKSLAIIKRGYKVVGGICFRPFAHRGFAEIVFFATSSNDQEKGYGAMLMNHFKMHIRRVYPDMKHFLTYADNFAVGYFRKQGFTKDITLDRSVWAGYIKDYEGGTIMQCTLLDKVDYLDVASTVAAQREAILAKIRQMSKSHVIYPGLPQFQPGQPDGVIVDPKDVPGLRESGWTPDMIAPPAPAAISATDRNIMNRVLSDMQTHSSSWPFKDPVSREEVPDYYNVIDSPMDLSTMAEKLDKGEYTTLEEFLNDCQLIFDNCKFYNPEDSIYVKSAVKLEECMHESLRRARGF
ncbi:Bromodomain-domain-containing protein [Peniophora sp. CONT]|nr:Bromodomain-domain-containing protein [Peniophora sp. CONT]